MAGRRLPHGRDADVREEADPQPLSRSSAFSRIRPPRKTGYPEEDAQLLGFSTALLYAIYKAKAQAKKEKPELEAIKERPEEEKRAKTTTIEFGGQEFTVIPGKGKRLKQTVVGHAVHDPEDYDAEIEAKFPAGWHDRLAKAFDTYLDAHSPKEHDHLFDLYKAWRDACKAGFDGVNLEKLLGWLKEHGEN